MIHKGEPADSENASASPGRTPDNDPQSMAGVDGHKAGSVKAMPVAPNANRPNLVDVAPEPTAVPDSRVGETAVVKTNNGFGRDEMRPRARRPRSRVRKGDSVRGDCISAPIAWVGVCSAKREGAVGRNPHTTAHRELVLPIRVGTWETRNAIPADVNRAPRLVDRRAPETRVLKILPVALAGPRVDVGVRVW